LSRRSTDLLAVSALAGVAAIVVTTVHVVAVRTAFAMPLLLACPGYSLTAAVFAGVPLERARRLLLALGLSLSLAVVGALVLSLTQVGLRDGSWAVLLTAVTWGAGVIGALRRERRAPSRLQLPRIRLVDVVLLALAALVAVGAMAFARAPLSAKNVQGYTALWLRPAPQAGVPAVQLGVASRELISVSYRLELEVGTHLVFDRRLTLEPGQQWEQVVHPAPATTLAVEPVHVRLYREDRPGVVYRWARLGPGVAAATQ
jgi:hypothetical protein